MDREGSNLDVADLVRDLGSLPFEEALERNSASARELTFVYRHYWPLEAQAALEPLAMAIRLALQEHNA
jgi:hypothetical protein